MPDDRGAVRELLEEPALFFRTRPHVPLIPAVFIAFVLAWEWVVTFFEVQAFIVPPPSAIWRALLGGLSSRLFLEHFWITLYETLAGFAIAAMTTFELIPKPNHTMMSGATAIFGSVWSATRYG